ncbi:hypothetical protein [Streptococcus sobrinus]|uniref:hypothetical protein n=1 Tax=Streptococcus sobrinus TaxID=1310 RepID=UPI0002F0261E|nr:hypothetical protein [Streptococcus sobrinus]
MSIKKILSLLCALVWFSQAILHLLILFGAPLGKLFFGGIYTVFPIWLRPANLILLLLWSTFAYAYLVYGRVMSAGNFDKKSAIFVKIATLLLGITTLFNFFVSHSFLEKYVTGGLTALTFLLSLWLLLLSKQNT